jgi:hypothetical protein
MQFVPIRICGQTGLELWNFSDAGERSGKVIK